MKRSVRPILPALAAIAALSAAPLLAQDTPAAPDAPAIAPAEQAVADAADSSAAPAAPPVEQAIADAADSSAAPAPAPAKIVVNSRVGEEIKPIEYDLSNYDSAMEYIDGDKGEGKGYARNVYYDKDHFNEHINTALTTIRGQVSRYGKFWSVVPPLVAILLALYTKRVYRSLVIGILVGAFLHSGIGMGALSLAFKTGFYGQTTDSYNFGILLFLVLLGTLVAMMNKTGASAAFGHWAETHIKSRVGAQIATIVLGMLIFVDDYFNCLTVGSVMKPVTDAKKVSRAKLAYLIDATAAPICIIAPISSWAAAVAAFAKDAGAESGLALFVKAIPWNFYAILTIVAMFFFALTGFDFGSMRKHEENALAGDLFTSGGPAGGNDSPSVNPKSRIYDLVVPVVFLVVACVVGMIHSGGYFGADKPGFVQAFSDSDASVGLVNGSIATIVFATVFFLARRVLSVKDCLTAIPRGFMAMLPAMLILICAWTLKSMTDALGAKVFISQIINGPAAGLRMFLPAIIFLIAVLLAFSTGTSWGTFGILIPIVLAAIPGSANTIIAVSACMAGAVCGDHCSPISDTTIMASAGAGCKHVNHVNTQLPYALLVAGVSFVAYIVAPFLKTWKTALPVAIVLMLAVLFVMKAVIGKRRAA